MTVRNYVVRESTRIKRRATVGLIGFGITNRAVYGKISELCNITVRCEGELQIPNGARGIFGDGYLDGIFEDILFLSPSVRRDTPELLLADSRGVKITAECDVFFECDENGGRKAFPLTGSDTNGGSKIFAVTGSDGKTTVTAMLSQMLSARAVGNIGVPYSEAEGEDRYVAELSSFNLNSFTPHSTAAVITSLSPNHLNWHSSLDEYYAAKLRIFENTGRAVMYAGGDCMQFTDRADTLFSDALTREELLALGARHTVSLSCGVILYDGTPLMRESELSLRERHNLLNFMAAAGVAFGYAPIESIREVGTGFRAPRHRCERVHTSSRGTVFINSSIDTTPTRTATTLSGINKRVLLILGGRGKGLSPLPLKEPILKYADGIIAYGEFGAELCELFLRDAELSRVPVIYKDRLSDGLYELKHILRGGETVVLSPAATAYGEFENFERRGELFGDFVKKQFP